MHSSAAPCDRLDLYMHSEILILSTPRQPCCWSVGEGGEPCGIRVRMILNAPVSIASAPNGRNSNTGFQQALSILYTQLSKAEYTWNQQTPVTLRPDLHHLLHVSTHRCLPFLIQDTSLIIPWCKCMQLLELWPHILQTWEIGGCTPGRCIILHRAATTIDGHDVLGQE